MATVLRGTSPYLKTYRLDFGPEWSKGIVTNEPPKIGKQFAALVPAVDRDGNSIAGIRMPAIEVPVGTYAGWNFRSPSIGSADQLFGEMGSFHPFARTKAERLASGDSRLSIEERYPTRADYLSKVTSVAKQMIQDRFLLPSDLPDLVAQAMNLYDWATHPHAVP